MTPFGILRGAVLVLLIVAAAIQYNDPDPLRWVALYVSTAVLTAMHRRWGQRRVRAALSVAILVVSLIWAVSIVNGMMAIPGLVELFQPMDPNRPEIEEGREVVGLLIVASWLAVLTWHDYDEV